MEITTNTLESLADTAVAVIISHDELLQRIAREEHGEDESFLDAYFVVNPDNHLVVTCADFYTLALLLMDSAIDPYDAELDYETLDRTVLIATFNNVTVV